MDNKTVKKLFTTCIGTLTACIMLLAMEACSSRSDVESTCNPDSNEMAAFERLNGELAKFTDNFEMTICHENKTRSLRSFFQRIVEQSKRIFWPKAQVLPYVV